MPIHPRILLVLVAAVLTGCTESSLVGSAVYQADLVLVQRRSVDPPTNVIGTPTGVPKIIVTTRNDGDGTAHSPHVELRLKQNGTIIEPARGTFPALGPGEQARAEIWLHDVATHSAYDTVDCRLHWLDARNRGHSRDC